MFVLLFSQTGPQLPQAGTHHEKYENFEVEDMRGHHKGSLDSGDTLVLENPSTLSDVTCDSSVYV